MRGDGPEGILPSPTWLESPYALNLGYKQRELMVSLHHYYFGCMTTNSLLDMELFK